MISLFQYISEKYKLSPHTERVNNKKIDSERKAKEKKEIDSGCSYYLVYYDKSNDKLHCKEIGFFAKSSEGRKEAEEAVSKHYSTWESGWSAKGWKRMGIKKRYQISSLPARDIDWY